MVSMDIFNSDAFSYTSLLAAIEKVPFKPQYLGDLGIFEDMPVRTTGVWIEERDGSLNLIQTTPRGAPIAQRTTEKRNARNFRTARIAKGDRIMADELQNIRAMGSETEVMQVQAEVARRLSGPSGIQSEIELTWENMRLGAIQGIVTDADSSVIYNFYNEFGISQPAEIAMNLDPSTGIQAGALRKFIADNIVRPLIRAAKGAFLPTTQIYALCGDGFYGLLVDHEEVRQTYLNWLAAQELRKGTAFEAFAFGGVNWVNYRGTDDASTIAVGSTKAKFFPVGAPGVFKAAWSPGETLEFVNTLGRPIYPMIVPDVQRQMYVNIEAYSYPLFICTRPDVLLSARDTA